MDRHPSLMGVNDDLAAIRDDLSPLTTLAVVLAVLLLTFGLAGYYYWEDAEQASGVGPVVKDWPTAEAEITGSRITHHGGYRELNVGYCTEFAYRYKVEGKNYRGRRYSTAGEPCLPTKEEADAIAQPYPKGAKVQVWVNPDDPQQAYLHAGADSDFTRRTRRLAYILWSIGGGIFVLFAWFTFETTRARRRS